MKALKILLLILSSLPALGQYPQGYFRNPLNLPLLLAGNFGECRPGHFHSGIDIKTGGKENQPVYAAAGGYVSRVKMEPGGFGHAIYITHPNGYTTLYAHLNDFFAELQDFVHRKQYERKNWELDLSFGPGQFPVEKGKLIARSGNTGGSMAPHLHFEIRDTKTEHPLNPLLFGFTLQDNIAPVPLHLAVYDGSRSVYLQDPQRFILNKKDTLYRPVKDTITVNSAMAGIGIHVNDYMNGSENTLSVYTIDWYLDGTLQGRILLDDIGYDETRYLHACADYKLKQQSGDWYNSLFLLPGNRLEHIYHDLNAFKGNLPLPDQEPHEVKLVLTDVQGNSSTVLCTLQRKEAPAAHTACTDVFTADAPAIFQHPNLRFRMEQGTLYDSVCFSFARTGDAQSFSGNLQLVPDYVPLHRYADMYVKPDKPVPFAWTSKMVLQVRAGNSVTGKAAVLKDGWYSASFRSFGVYRLLVDTIAPKILPLQKNNVLLKGKKELRFRVTDNLSRVSRLEGMLDGRWVCMEQHGNDWFYRFDEYCPEGDHRLVISASDENGNEGRLVYPFRR